MQILNDAAVRAIAYLNSLHNRPVIPRRDAIERLDILETVAPQKSTASDEVWRGSMSLFRQRRWRWRARDFLDS